MSDKKKIRTKQKNLSYLLNKNIEPYFSVLNNSLVKRAQLT